MQTSVAPVFRFKNSSDLNEILERFAMIHCNDTDYQEFNEAWDLFYDENSEIIEADFRRHVELGFKGDFKKKLYTSVRYYHCKRFALGDGKVTGDTKEDGSKRTYKKVHENVSDTIDKFLEEKITITTKPAAAYTNFCEEHGNDFCEKKCSENTYQHIRFLCYKGVKMIFAKSYHFRKIHIAIFCYKGGHNC